MYRKSADGRRGRRSEQFVTVLTTRVQPAKEERTRDDRDAPRAPSVTTLTRLAHGHGAMLPRVPRPRPRDIVCPQGYSFTR